MRLAYGEGALVAILAPIIAALFGLITVYETFFLIFLLFGAWTILSSFIFVVQNQRIYYLSWGLVLACISSAFITKIQYALALILIAVIAVLFVNAFTRSRSRSSSTQMSRNQQQQQRV